jgi:formylglycine-generating enzyme required for sulfatase activity
MKNLLTIVLINSIALLALAQAPQKFSYQSVIRNAGNQLVANQNVGIKISILQGNATGSAVYAETHSPLTNANGLASLEIGGGGSNPLNIETALIPAGTFAMGSPLTEPDRFDNEVQHQVTLSAFRMSKYETSNAQFAAFLNANNIGANGIYAAGAYPTEPLVYDCGVISYTGTQWQPAAGFENYPVVCVTWYGAQEFATYAGGRLPTEAEWEYACRGNTTTAFSTGACLNNTQANYRWDFPLTGCSNTNTAYPNQTQAVNSYSPNAYGLYNMHGNVWEWCADWYGDYPTAAQTNPTGPSTGPYRVFRGGSWSDIALYCRSAIRNYGSPITTTGNIGFRLAFVP